MHGPWFLSTASDCAGLYTEDLMLYPILWIIFAGTKSSCLHLLSCLILRELHDLRNELSMGTKGIMDNWHMLPNIISIPSYHKLHMHIFLKPSVEIHLIFLKKWIKLLHYFWLLDDHYLWLFLKNSNTNHLESLERTIL